MTTKRIVSLFLTLIMVISMFSVTVYAEDGIKVLLDGQELVFDVPPQLINDRTMVPMRKIFESMGASVEWDGDTQTVTATKDDITVIMQIDNNVIKVNGEDITLDVPPQLVDSRTLVPARAVAESLNAKVDWDEENQTVLITSEKITSIDLSQQTEFICNVGATITYGYDDIWYKTVGTELIPQIIMVDSAYVGQVVLISPLYANFAIDNNGKAKVTYSVKCRKPDGKEDYLVKDLVAIDGKAMPEQIIKSTSNIEYGIDETDPLGTYTFTVESRDVIGNKKTENVFAVTFSSYEYKKNEFQSGVELLSFVTNYGRTPNPDRIIDAIIYAEKQKITPYPIFFTSFVEMLAKNPYLGEAAIREFEKEFGAGGTEMLMLIENTAAQYLNNIMSANPPTITNVVVAEDIKGDVMMYGGNMGAYFASASYNAAKVLVEAFSKEQFSEEVMQEYGIPDLKGLVENDPLLNAYCVYMLNYDNSIDSETKAAVSELLK